MLPFTPPRWARGPHAQTLAGWLLRRRVVARWRRERLALPDGDFVDLDWSAPIAESHDDAPLVVLLHGLEGSSRSGYVATLARALHAAGCASVALNFRGCSGEPNRLPRAYHAGETGDLAHVVERLRARFPTRPLHAVGFSLGGNVLLRWLGEAGEAARGLVTAAAAVSVPFDLAAGADWTAVGPGRGYAGQLLRSLRAKARAKGPQVADRIDLARTLRARTFREFDDAFTAPLHGFRDADDYYARSSSSPWLAAVAVPTLLLHAEDDPFLPAAAIPRAALAANPLLDARISRCGGHVGFVAGTPWRPRFAAEEAIARFLAARP